jgi:hypothetical protein
MSNFYKLINEKSEEPKKISKENVTLEMLQAVAELFKETGIEMVDKKYGFTFDNFVTGIKTEAEHGDHDKETDVIPDVNGHDSPIVLTKIVIAHCKEMPDYYDKLKKAMPNG